MAAPEIKERINPNYIFIVGEPITKRPSSPDLLTVPYGDMRWAQTIARKNLSSEQEAQVVGQEYWDIVQTLKRNNVPFKFIVAHQDLVDKTLVLGISEILGVKGIGMFEQIPAEFSCFPRDMFFDLKGTILINPRANLEPMDNSLVTSMIGEGGGILQQGNKLLLPSPEGYEKRRKDYENDIAKLPEENRIGFLPWPVGVMIDLDGIPKEGFLSNHLDRVASFIKGKNGQDYLLVDPYYYKENQPPWGSYARVIEAVCKEMDIYLIVIDKKPDDVPYALNLVQFEDDSIFMSSGHLSLQQTIEQIVGKDNVFTTHEPIVYFPVLRNAGIRCLTANAPKRMFRPK